MSNENINENENKNIEENSEEIKQEKIDDTNKAKTQKKNNFVPAYMRKNETEEQEETVEEIADKSKKKTKKKKSKKVKKERKIKSKITLIIIAVILVVAILITSLVIFFVNRSKELGYYDKTIIDYGISKLYNNEEVIPSQKLEKAEALKIIIGTTLNISDITQQLPHDLLYYKKDTTGSDSNSINLDALFGQISEENKIPEEYTNEYWIRYAKSINFITEDEITKDNYNKNITYEDVFRYLANAKTMLIGKALDSEITPSFKDYEKYNSTVKLAIADLAFNQIIEDSKSRINADKVIDKEAFNEIMVKFIQKYNLITINDEKININKEKMPSNTEEFAYTLSTVDKSTYEIQNYKANENYKNARDTFKNIKENYEAINGRVEEYYNLILNVDYETIGEEFKEQIDNLTSHRLLEEKIDNYIQYVKTNKIKVTGEAKVQNPIIYFDGNLYRVRTKITYEITSANELKNIFFGDTESTYEEKQKTMYIDVPTNSLVKFKNYFYIESTPINNIVAGQIQ